MTISDEVKHSFIWGLVALGVIIALTTMGASCYRNQLDACKKAIENKDAVAVMRLCV